MQTSNKKIKKFAEALGEVISEYRKDIVKTTINRFENEYGLTNHTMERIEKGKFNCKFITLWAISEALNIPVEDIVKKLRLKLGNQFKIIEE